MHKIHNRISFHAKKQRLPVESLKSPEKSDEEYFTMLATGTTKKGTRTEDSLSHAGPGHSHNLTVKRSGLRSTACGQRLLVSRPGLWTTAPASGKPPNLVFKCIPTHTSTSIPQVKPNVICSLLYTVMLSTSAAHWPASNSV